MIIFQSAPFPANAQGVDTIDSLKNVLASQKEEDQYTTLISLAFAYVDKDNEQSLSYIDKAHDAAIMLADSAKIIKSARIKGQLFRRLDRLDEAISIFEYHLPIAIRNGMMDDYKLMLNSLAIAFTDRGEFHKALQYHFQSLELREREGDKGEISVSLDNIGRVYYKLNDYTKAIEYYEHSLELKKASGKDYAGYLTLINLGYCYVGLERYSEARDYFIQGLKLCGEDCPVHQRIDGEHGLGRSYLGEDNPEQALIHLEHSYEMAVQADDKRFQVENLVVISRIVLADNQYESALNKLRKAEALALEAGYVESLIDTYELLSLLYKGKSDYQEASYYQDKYISLKDSVYSEGFIRNIASIQTRLEERENIKKIAHRDDELARQRMLIIAVVIIALLASLLVFMLIRSNKNKRIANERLDREVKAATSNLQAANQLLAEVNKELDHFIYKTSHDIRGPLASLKGLCNVALSDVGDPTALSYLQKLDLTASQLDSLLLRLQKINQINHAPMHPLPVDFTEITSHVELLERKKGLPSRLSISYEIQKDLGFKADNELVTLILENLISNAIKFHDRSDRKSPFVSIRILKEDDNIVIEVTDNGIGIGATNPEELFHIFARASERSVSGGVGLYLSRRAAQKLGGKIDLGTTPEGYTQVVVTLPFELSAQAMPSL